MIPMAAFKCRAAPASSLEGKPKSTLCRIPIRHGGPETRRNPPLQLSQISYAVTTRLLRTLRVVPIGAKSVIRTRSCRPSLVALPAPVSRRRCTPETGTATVQRIYLCPIRCTYRDGIRPFIKDVDDRLPDLIRVWIHVRRIPYLKGLFSDTALHLEAIRLQVVAIPGESASMRFHCEYGLMNRARNQTSHSRPTIPPARMAPIPHG